MPADYGPFPGAAREGLHPIANAPPGTDPGRAGRGRGISSPIPPTCRAENKHRAPRYDVGKTVKRPENLKAIGKPGRSW
ncbi:hypothetical protein ACFC1R_37195 [Kitasatospora sp. NPDC056138]|uniref:hypothetical protein n=1 Tax=Kitasatospora sp. NPDC056138 TaxID=3345724 RepID=UPI0035DF4098